MSRTKEKSNWSQILNTKSFHPDISNLCKTCFRVITTARPGGERFSITRRISCKWEACPCFHCSGIFQSRMDNIGSCQRNSLNQSTLLCSPLCLLLWTILCLLQRLPLFKFESKRREKKVHITIRFNHTIGNIILYYSM